jgi:hypothetical protein
MMSWEWRLQSLVTSLLVVVCASADSCTHPDGFTILSQADANSISVCQSFNGNINLSPAITGNITLNGPVNVIGGVYTLSGGAENAGFIGIPSTTLVSVSESLVLGPFGNLQSISFPRSKGRW